MEADDEIREMVIRTNLEIAIEVAGLSILSRLLPPRSPRTEALLRNALNRSTDFHLLIMALAQKEVLGPPLIEPLVEHLDDCFVLSVIDAIREPIAKSTDPDLDAFIADPENRLGFLNDLVFAE
jgi:hypothetical protein